MYSTSLAFSLESLHFSDLDVEQNLFAWQLEVIFRKEPSMMLEAATASSEFFLSHFIRVCNTRIEAWKIYCGFMHNWNERAARSEYFHFEITARWIYLRIYLQGNKFESRLRSDLKPFSGATFHLPCISVAIFMHFNKIFFIEDSIYDWSAFFHTFIAVNDQVSNSQR